MTRKGSWGIAAVLPLFLLHASSGAQDTQPQTRPTETAPASPPAFPIFMTPPAAPSTPPPNPNVISEMPEFQGIDQWFNSPPLTKADLKGKVVLVDFWTYSCINCLRTLPYLKDWHKKYKAKGLVIVGVHSPEFEFERDPVNVKAAIDKHQILFPVALDNKMQTWTAYKNQAWPAHYFVDAQGKIRHIHYGEGDYQNSEATIQKLLMERSYKKAETQPAQAVPKGKKGRKAAAPTKPASAKGGETQPAMPPLTHLPPEVDFAQVKSPETYLGFVRRERLVTSGRPIELNEWMVDGKWRTEGERVFLVEGMGKIQFRFSAAKVNLVMKSDAAPVSAVILLDGQPLPKEKAGKDVQGAGLLIMEPRLYELVNLGEKGEEHTIEIQFLGPGVGVYAFTFG